MAISLGKFLLLILGFVALVRSTTLSRFHEDDPAPGGLAFKYPYPVHFYHFTSQQQNLTMAYMDVPPSNTTSYAGIIVLLHGKNFCGATWNTTAHALASIGYRVVIPDQIGFCKSSKTMHYQFSLHQLATNTNFLLQSLNITSAIIMGHSMGGMISARYALTFPSQTQRLILVDPLGLEDWQALGVPYQRPDLSFITELATTYTSIMTYQKSTYYGGTWDPAYDEWVNMLLEVYTGPQGRTFAWDMALVTDAVFVEPIVYQLPNLTMRSLLVVGDLDNTAIGKAWAPASVQAVVGHYEVLGKEVAARVPWMDLVELEGLGHSPQIQDFETFWEAVEGWLREV
ncbi:hypothetical protein BHYA_0006g00140 [Botrytis hyacinthi]|uniref:AB hydrolase-1 domain-containing protein n=1 Tax=Botrytis hyacinthi TaxID=278943 RepID=A0A4Z1H056_9HELO|nr:hypothetical protein BHYA_0006g00140 [Botrytis hyacinthi]